MLKRLQQGGRKSISANKWIKFTVRYSINQFLRAGGGLLLIHAEGTESPIKVVILKNKHINPLN